MLIGNSHDGQIYVCHLVAMVIWYIVNAANCGQNVPVGSTPTDTIGPRSRSRLSARYVLLVLKWPKNRSIFKARQVSSFDIVQSDRRAQSWDLWVWTDLLTIGHDYRKRVCDVWKSARRVNRLLEFLHNLATAVIQSFSNTLWLFRALSASCWIFSIRFLSSAAVYECTVAIQVWTNHSRRPYGKPALPFLKGRCWQNLGS